MTRVRIQLGGSLKHTTATLAAALGLAAGPAAAQGVQADDPAYVSVAGGGFNVTDSGPGGDAAADVRLEYRHDERFLWLKPWAGLELTGDGGIWGGGGIAFDAAVTEHIVVTLSTGVGAYGRGSGKDLGAVTEFRSQLELGYRFPDRSRLTAAFGHLSNAGIGETNPGAETATLYYHVPLTNLAGLLN
jgi:hypothetical protein